MSNESLVLVDRPFPDCALVTLNRPSALNALSRDLRRSLVTILRALEADPLVRVLVLTGQGKAFSAGMDLKELGSSADPAAMLAPVPDEDPVYALGEFSGPVICAVNGFAITGGLELALACDVLIASENARFADTHARVGVLPGWGLSQKLARLIGSQRAKEMSFSGNFIDARRAEAWGLVNRVVAHDALLTQSLALARDMLGSLPAMLPAYKKLIDDGMGMTLAEGMQLEHDRSRAARTSLAAEDIEGRRTQVAERARKSQADHHDGSSGDALRRP